VLSSAGSQTNENIVVARRCSSARSPRVHGAFTAHLTVNGKQYTQRSM
jgi:hypothetical protein